MKNTVLIVTVLAFGLFFLIQCQSVMPDGPVQQASFGSTIPSGKALMKIQQAHLRTIDPFDIDIVPEMRPVTEAYPLGSMFGMRKHPILNVDKMHLGVDFPAPAGTPVLATATGRVQKVITRADSSSYGKHIVLEHDELYLSLYAHLSGVAVSPGQLVTEGDTIGFVGSTGRSTNPHLHYEIIRDGQRIDPAKVFSKISDS